MAATPKIVTISTGVNIAVIKYWGKRDEKLILPINSSLSATLDQKDLRTVTSIAVSPNFEKDRLWLNGKEVSVTADRTASVLREMRSRADPELAKQHVHIASYNNFPTAAGLASSAAGFAALVFALSKALDLSGDAASPEQLSIVARQGSGSASRSLMGGWVKWKKGERADGLDSFAVPIEPETHWPEMEVLVLIVSDRQKQVSSTSGMSDSVRTSDLLRLRAANTVEQRCEQLEQSLHERDFETFANATIQDSNEFHGCCLATQPPIIYMRGPSFRVTRLVHALNSASGKAVASYTFDAGPNAVLYLPRDNVPLVVRAVFHYFPPELVAGTTDSTPLVDALPAGYLNRPELLAAAGLHTVGDLANIDASLPADLIKSLEKMPRKTSQLRGILHTRPGPGPQVLDASESLLDATTGLPIYTNEASTVTSS